MSVCSKLPLNVSKDIRTIASMRRVSHSTINACTSPCGVLCRSKRELPRGSDTDTKHYLNDRDTSSSGVTTACKTV